MYIKDFLKNCKKKVSAKALFFVLRFAWKHFVFKLVRSCLGEDHWNSYFYFHDYILRI